MDTVSGRVPLAPGSHPTGQAGCAVCGAARFDPSRATPMACPFCGNDKVQTNTKAKSYFAKRQAQREGRDTSNYLCRCTKCGAKGPLTHSRDAAVWAWNGRYEGDGGSTMTTPYTPGLITRILKASSPAELSRFTAHDFQRWPAKIIQPARLIKELIAAEKSARGRA